MDTIKLTIAIPTAGRVSMSFAFALVQLISHIALHGIRSRLDPSRVSDLLSYVRAGFAPRNPALKNAGHDGVTTGAVEIAAVLSSPVWIST